MDVGHSIFLISAPKNRVEKLVTRKIITINLIKFTDIGSYFAIVCTKLQKAGTERIIRKKLSVHFLRVLHAVRLFNYIAT